MYMKNLQAARDAVDLSAVSEPKKEAEKGDLIVGVLPDEIKRLYVVCLDFKQEVNERRKKARANYRGIRKLLAIITGRFNDQKYLVSKLELLLRILDTEIREEFPIIRDREKIAVYKGWRVAIIGSIYDSFKRPSDGGFFHM